VEGNKNSRHPKGQRPGESVRFQDLTSKKQKLIPAAMRGMQPGQ
jgi:hypothetical protein